MKTVGNKCYVGVDSRGHRTVIDYSKPAKDILWQCIEVATCSLLRKSRTRLGHDFGDVQHDIYVKSYDKIMQDLHKWDGVWPFYNFVFYRVWGTYGDTISSYINRNRIKYNQFVRLAEDNEAENNEVSYNTVDDTTKLYYSNGHDYRRLHRLKKDPVLSRQDLQNDYDIYVDCCYEFGVDPVSKDEYEGKDEDAT